MHCAAAFVVAFLFAVGQCIDSSYARHLRKPQPLATRSELCIGDMCTPYAGNVMEQRWRSSEQLSRTRQDPAEMLATSQGWGCPADLASDAKVMLMPIVPMYHGSTALESVFMSSPRITTICSAGTWQCEPRLDFDGLPHSIRENLLPRYAQYWDMSKPILFEKGPRGMNEKVVREYNELEKERKEYNFLEKQGIHDFKLAYVLMWRPVCLSKLSSHAMKDIEKDPQQFARDELVWFEDLVASHKFLTEKGVPVLVTNLADMMWRVEWSKWRLQRFMPCLGELDFNYVPQMNKDIFPDNEWKADGSIVDFGKAVDPPSVGYNIDEGACHGDGAFFGLLEGDEYDRAMSAVKYLVDRS